MRKLSDAERREHQETLELLARLIVGMPAARTLRREFIVFSV